MSQDALSRIRGGGIPPVSPSSGPVAPSSSASAGAPPSGCTNADSPSPISLSVPRPEHQRSTNVYVDTPFQHRVPSRAPFSITGAGGRSQHDIPLVHGASSTGRTPLHRLHSAKKLPGPSTPSKETPTLQKQQQQQQKVSTGSFVSQQPKTFKKEASEEDSIICNRCGRCRCDACTTPKRPGGVWLFGGKCHCSPAEAVDFLSCLCCVKGVLYHCGKDTEEGVPNVDRPCSCSAPDAALRWVCLAAASVPLPCLLCYWPLTWTRRVCEGTYRRFSSHGCRCDSSHSHAVPRRIQPTLGPPEKRLLQDCV